MYIYSSYLSLHQRLDWHSSEASGAEIGLSKFLSGKGSNRKCPTCLDGRRKLITKDFYGFGSS